MSRKIRKYASRRRKESPGEDVFLYIARQYFLVVRGIFLRIRIAIRNCECCVLLKLLFKVSNNFVYLRFRYYEHSLRMKGSV